VLAVFTSLLAPAPDTRVAAQEPVDAPPAAPSTRPAAAAIISLSGQIDDFSRDTFIRRFKQAKAHGAKTIIVDLDTYGGLVTAGLDLSRFLKNQSDVHSIAFVDTKAISAGAMIAIACDEIVMADNAVIGDCAPISISSDGHLEAMPAAERAKMESPILADFRDSAQRHGYDVRLAEAMVAVGTVAYGVRDEAGDHAIRYVDEKEYQDLTQNGWKPYPDTRQPIDSAESLLTVHTAGAIALGLAKGKAASPEDLAEQRHLNLVATYQSSMGDQVVEWLANSVVRGILLSIFLMALYAALNAPGHSAAEAIATLSLGLLVGVPLLTGFATWWELLLIFGGLALLAFEIFVFPGHGVSAILGALMILVGLVMTFVGREPSGPGFMPVLPQTWAALQRGVLVVTGGLICSLFLWLWLQRYLPKVPYFNRLILNSTVGGTTGRAELATPAPAPWPTVGAVGTAVTDLRPGGVASFFDDATNDSRTTNVVCECGYVRATSPVMVREVSGNRVVVRPVP
jgi:membrane-bound serine protease (ClpP class)